MNVFVYYPPKNRGSKDIEVTLPSGIPWLSIWFPCVPGYMVCERGASGIPGLPDHHGGWQVLPPHPRSVWRGRGTLLRHRGEPQRQGNLLRHAVCGGATQREDARCADQDIRGNHVRVTHTCDQFRIDSIFGVHIKNRYKCLELKPFITTCKSIFTHNFVYLYDNLSRERLHNLAYFFSQWKAALLIHWNSDNYGDENLQTIDYRGPITGTRLHPVFWGTLRNHSNWYTTQIRGATRDPSLREILNHDYDWNAAEVSAGWLDDFRADSAQVPPGAEECDNDGGNQGHLWGRRHRYVLHLNYASHYGRVMLPFAN